VVIAEVPMSDDAKARFIGFFERPTDDLAARSRRVWYRGVITLPATLVLLSLAA
jgi:hypothetical protein